MDMYVNKLLLVHKKLRQSAQLVTSASMESVIPASMATFASQVRLLRPLSTVRLVLSAAKVTIVSRPMRRLDQLLKRLAVLANTNLTSVVPL